MLWGELMAMASLISLPTLIVYMLAHKRIKETSITAGIKG
jgi:ABC-type glycerol-3-phosphate transport system permease component